MKFPSAGLASLRLAPVLALCLLTAFSDQPPPLYGDSTIRALCPLLANPCHAVDGTRAVDLLHGDGVNPPWTPHRAIVGFGMNEAGQRMPIATFKASLRELGPVVFVTPVPATRPGWDTSPYAQAMREVAAESGAQVIDVRDCFQRQPNWRERLPDGVHADDAGRRYEVKECILPALK